MDYLQLTDIYLLHPKTPTKQWHIFVCDKLWLSRNIDTNTARNGVSYKQSGITIDFETQTVNM
jgi:hypothetical protein